MDLRFTQQISKGLWGLLFSFVLANGFVLIFYFARFGWENWFNLSKDQQDWAHFGTYYGGLMGPFVGLLAFIGICFTILLQKKQLELAKQQVEIQEMQRVLASVSAQIDQMLTIVPTYFDAESKLAFPGAPQSLGNHIAKLGAEFLTRNTAGYTSAPSGAFKSVMQDIALSVKAVALEFQSLGWTLEKFKEAGGSETMVDFYKFRYRMTIVYLEAMNAIDATSRIRKVIDIAELTQQVNAGQTGAD